MTKFQEAYREVIQEVSDTEWDKKDHAWRLGNAGVAIGLSVLEDGNAQLTHLKQRIPDFSQTELRMALARLKQNGFLHYEEDDKEYRLVVDKGTSVEDTLYWSLLANVANGFMERTN